MLLYTQKHILDLLVDVMYEASFFGFAQEKLDEEIEKLEESIRQAKAGKTYSMDEVFEHLGLEREEKDEQADTLRYKIIEDIMAFDRYNRQKELSVLVKLERQGYRKCIIADMSSAHKDTIHSELQLNLNKKISPERSSDKLVGLFFFYLG